ncbi:hypothetical protein [Pseudomonas sp. zfem003]|nr:hypothetical protein [Pseudomonas sp. zfem003]MDU9398062.1 hypothetical protein [Pseudomonas sp. zfem003]
MTIKSCWLVILPWKAFYMVGEPCTQAEALTYARGIWHHAEVE